MNICKIALSSINWDDRSFEIRDFGAGARIHDSLDRFGILDPPWLAASNAGYSIVDGFKRLSFARETGVSDISCVVLPDGLSPGEIWERRIDKKVLEGGLNPAEKACVAAALKKLWPADAVPEFFLNALEIPNRSGLIEKWSRLFECGEELLSGLASGEIAERSALEFSEWEPEEVRAVVALLGGLRCSASIQFEIVERIAEIAIREQVSRLTILGGPELRNLISDEEMNHRRKTQLVRDLLTRLRFPRISLREARFRSDLKTLSLPSAIKIIPPAAFEGDAWRMELSFSNAGELRSAADAAVELARGDGIEKVLAPDIPAERR